MRRAVIALAALTAGLVAGEIALSPGGHLPLGASAVFGVVGCAVIVVVSKLAGRAGLQRPETDDD